MTSPHERPDESTGLAAPAAGDAELDRIRGAVLGCPGVAGMSAGGFADYLPGRRVEGVRIADEQVTVQIVARYGPPLPDLAEAIGAALRPLLAGRSLQVSVDDVLLPGQNLAAEPA